MSSHLSKELATTLILIAQIRRLHAPVRYRDQIICGHCSGYAGESCDNAPEIYPCPTVKILEK